MHTDDYVLARCSLMQERHQERHARNRAARNTIGQQRNFCTGTRAYSQSMQTDDYILSRCSLTQKRHQERQARNTIGQQRNFCTSTRAYSQNMHSHDYGKSRRSLMRRRHQGTPSGRPGTPLGWYSWSAPGSRTQARRWAAGPHRKRPQASTSIHLPVAVPQLRECY